jgi:hypothetical protein
MTEAELIHDPQVLAELECALVSVDLETRGTSET